MLHGKNYMILQVYIHTVKLYHKLTESIVLVTFFFIFQLPLSLQNIKMSRISSILFVCVLIGVSYGLSIQDDEKTERQLRSLFDSMLQEPMSREQRSLWDYVKNILSENKGPITEMVKNILGRRDVNDMFQTANDQ
ncbi:hypothetical protein Btru_066436 [Bulinus truncatus]|nr:hypothetical protein Btru_066436 [Bulinus truncatus]